MRLTTLLLSFLLPVGIFSQHLAGRVLDRQSETPLTGATVELLLPDGVRGTTTDADGAFLLPDVPPGRQTLRLSYLGYAPETVANVPVTAGKDVYLEVSLTENVTDLSTVTVRAGTGATPVNEMATLSVQQFTAEQVNRFAGGRADVSRLAGNLAGVATADDSRNDIVIRGNSPSGLLWQLEGISIPNPNHFATLGTTGGPVSALNPNLLASSDFATSAFAAEYGNALSGVFDLRLRRGNRERYEFMGQLGTFSGLEAMVEGPLRGKGSFVVSLRNSFVGLASSLGIDIGTNATPDYRDLTFNVDLGNRKAGNFSVFGIGGTSRIDFLASEVDTTDLFADPRRNTYPRSYFGVLGLRHNLITGENTYLRTVVSANLQGNTYEQYAVDEALSDALLYTQVDDRTRGYGIKSYLNSKLSPRTTFRAGLQGELKDLRTRVDDRDGRPDRDGDGVRDLDRLRDFDGNFTILQAFAQSRYRAGTRWTVNTGLHLQYFTLNGATAVEPRLGVAYEVTERIELSAAYGRHAQVPAYPVFFFRDVTTGRPGANDGLGFLRADHYVTGLEVRIGAAWRAKSEVYYQRLFDVPVDAFPSGFSLLNAGADFVFPQRGNLVGEGTGTNYGVELTLDRSFRDNWYLLATGSVFESRYVGSDGVERNTAFNNRYVGNLLGGKEWPFGHGGRHRLTVNSKLTASGGRYFTPVDLPASRAADTDVRDERRPYSERYAGYFRWDLKFGVQFNHRNKKFSQSFFVDLQNLTDRENVFQERYSPTTGQVNTAYQSGFFPDIQYRIQF